MATASTPPQAEEESGTAPTETGSPTGEFSFSSQPTTEEISQSNLLPVPLVPKGQPGDAENQALASALMVYRARTVEDEFGPLVGFLDQFPESPWRLALLTNLGIGYFKTGHFSKAMTAWGAAWQIGKGEDDQRIKPIADRAIGELAKLNARLGRVDQLEAIFAEIEGRMFSGSSSE